MRILDEEIGSAVQKRELSVLAKYMEMWEPMNFIRREEVRKIVEDIIEDIKTEGLRSKTKYI